MKCSIFFTAFIILVFSFSIHAQDFSRLEKLTNQLKQKANFLVNETSKSLKKEKINSSEDIKRAFLAQQLQASVLLIEKIISNKRHQSELRYAGMVLVDLSKDFPSSGKNSFEWKKSKDLINNLSREVRGINSEGNFQKGYEVDENKIIGRAFWNGTVDSDVQIVLNKERLLTRTIAGKRFSKGIYSFTSSLPEKNRIRVGVRKKSGRGEVHVMQQPSEENNFTAIIQIHDEDSGAKPYSIEIYWYRR